MYWLEISVLTDGEAAEAVAEVLRPYAYQEGVVLEQLGDMEDLAPDALEPVVTVKIYVPEEQDTPALRRRIEEMLYYLNRLYPVPPPTFRKLQEKDWANAWKDHYHPFRIGRRIWIEPSWIDRSAKDREQKAVSQPGDVVLTLDPGMAFGTGTHPTTQMCLQVLEELVRPGTSVLDVGTGSGILAIAAAKLGAATLLGVDTDDIAVRTARNNAINNGINHFEARSGTLADVTRKPWDLVVVNILAPVIIHLLAEGELLDYVAPAGHLVLSGIIDEQVAAVETAVVQAGGIVHDRRAIRDWVTLVAGTQKRHAL